MISYNPASQEIIWEGKPSSKDTVDASVERATKAFGLWRETSINTRVDLLIRYKKILERERETLALLISKETGKMLSDAKGEVNALIGKIDISIEAQAIRCAPFHKGGVYTSHRPIGVTAVIAPFNFPLHLPNGHIVPALLAGNCVILKPSELTPACGEMLHRLFLEAGFPKDVVQCVQGGKEVGEMLATNPSIKALLFTGSRAVGVALSKIFASTPERLLALELGGNNPMLLADIDQFEKTAHLITQSAYLSAGQRCTAARRLIIVDTLEHRKFLSYLIEKIRSLRAGAYDETPEPNLGPLTDPNGIKRALSYEKLLLNHGGVSLIPLKTSGPFLFPGLIDMSFGTSADEECFAPFLQLKWVNSFEEGIKEANQTKYGLSAALISRKKQHWEQFFSQINAGIINWNAPTNGASSYAPFGGVGYSGNHRPTAFYAADYCNYPVVSTIKD